MISALLLTLFCDAFAAPRQITAQTTTSSTPSTQVGLRTRVVNLSAEQQATLQKAMANPTTAASVQKAILSQLSVQKPLGIVNGKWAVPMDPRVLTAAAGLSNGFTVEGVGAVAATDAGIVVLIPNNIYQEFGGNILAEVNATLGEMDSLIATAQAAGPTDDVITFILYTGLCIVEATPVVLAVTAGAVGGIIVYEYLDDTGAEDDFDDDGITNQRDPDDDNDGTSDVDDNAPFDPDKKICDLCGNRPTPPSLTTLTAQTDALTNVLLSGLDATLGTPALQLAATASMPAVQVISVR